MTASPSHSLVRATSVHESDDEEGDNSRFLATIELSDQQQLPVRDSSNATPTAKPVVDDGDSDNEHGIVPVVQADVEWGQARVAQEADAMPEAEDVNYDDDDDDDSIHIRAEFISATFYKESQEVYWGLHWEEIQLDDDDDNDNDNDNTNATVLVLASIDQGRGLAAQASVLPFAPGDHLLSVNHQLTEDSIRRATKLLEECQGLVTLVFRRRHAKVISNCVECMATFAALTHSPIRDLTHATDDWGLHYQTDSSANNNSPAGENARCFLWLDVVHPQGPFGESLLHVGDVVLSINTHCCNGHDTLLPQNGTVSPPMKNYCLTIVAQTKERTALVVGEEGTGGHHRHKYHNLICSNNKRRAVPPPQLEAPPPLLPGYYFDGGASRPHHMANDCCRMTRGKCLLCFLMVFTIVVVLIAGLRRLS